MAIYAYVSGEDQMKNRHKSESGGSAFFTFFLNYPRDALFTKIQT